MTDENDDIPTCGEHRGVPLHAGQAPSRIEAVRHDIDAVYKLSDATVLFDWAASPEHAPESRLFARARIEALASLASDGRRTGPAIDMAKLRAVTAGLSCRRWRDRHFYTTILQPEPPLRQGGPRPVRREIPLSDAD